MTQYYATIVLKQYNNPKFVDVLSHCYRNLKVTLSYVTR